MHNITLQNGPYGVLMHVDGSPISPSAMRCRVVSGSLSDIDEENPGWRNKGFDDSAWGIAEVKLWFVYGRFIVHSDLFL